MANIKKIKLSNGQIYSIFDEGALRLNEDKIICTGNKVVDAVIIQGHLSIEEIDDIPLADTGYKVLVPGPNGIIGLQDIRKVLRDLGVVTGWCDNNGCLELEYIDI